jgi:hypothetical protein
MFRNPTLEVFLILLIILVVLSMIPIIELKYHNDLYETIETFNKYCLNNDAELVNDLDVKDTYMWNMANYLYNFETINEFFLKKDNESNRALYDENAIDKKDDNTIWKGYDYQKLDETYIINLPKSVLYLYRQYGDMSAGVFTILILLFISLMYYGSYLEDLKMCVSGDDKNINDFLRYCLYAFIVYILLFITFFSIISKKITELYKEDTDTYEYIMLMKSLDILLKENKIDKPDNKAIIDILKKYSKNKINDIGYIAINNRRAMYELSKAQEEKAKKANKEDKANKDFLYDNKGDYLIRLKNVHRLTYYNSDESKNKVKDKVADIFRFIYAYVFFLIVPIYVLSISLKGNYIYLLGTIIAMIIFSIAVYNMYNTLQ